MQGSPCTVNGQASTLVVSTNNTTGAVSLFCYVDTAAGACAAQGGTFGTGPNLAGDIFGRTIIFTCNGRTSPDDFPLENFCFATPGYNNLLVAFGGNNDLTCGGFPDQLCREPRAGAFTGPRFHCCTADSRQKSGKLPARCQPEAVANRSGLVEADRNAKLVILGIFERKAKHEADELDQVSSTTSGLGGWFAGVGCAALVFSFWDTGVVTVLVTVVGFVIFFFFYLLPGGDS